MTTKRETILAALRSSLTGTVGVGTRIYRSRVEPIARQESPAIVIEPVIDLTGTDATMVLRYLTYVSSVNSGVSITLSTPAATTQTATSLSFRSLDSGKALLKNWTVSW